MSTGYGESHTATWTSVLTWPCGGLYTLPGSAFQRPPSHYHGLQTTMEHEKVIRKKKKMQESDRWKRLTTECLPAAEHGWVGTRHKEPSSGATEKLCTCGSVGRPGLKRLQPEISLCALVRLLGLHISPTGTCVPHCGGCRGGGSGRLCCGLGGRGGSQPHTLSSAVNFKPLHFVLKNGKALSSKRPHRKCKK